MEVRPVDFKVWVPGVPRAKGNMAAGKFRGVHDVSRGMREWTRAIQAAILEHRCNPPVEKSAFFVRTHFFFLVDQWKRSGVPGTAYMEKPDGDKLTRCVWDALTKYIFGDDCRVTDWDGRKRWGKTTAGLWLTVKELGPLHGVATAQEPPLLIDN